MIRQAGLHCTACATCCAASPSLSPFSARFVCFSTHFKRYSLLALAPLEHPSVVGQDSRLAAARMQENGPCCLCPSAASSTSWYQRKTLPHGRRTSLVVQCPVRPDYGRHVESLACNTHLERLFSSRRLPNLPTGRALCLVQTLH